MIHLLIVLTLSVIFILIRYLFIEAFAQQWKAPDTEFPVKWKIILEEKITYYNLLTEEEKIKFQKRIHTFMYNVTITGIKTSVTDEDKILLASSAIIPVFSFPDWEYNFLEEILLFPDDFSINIEKKESPKMNGMVGGNGYFDGKMMLSRKALEAGFKNINDKLNVGIHEFTHIIDKEDLAIDGVPKKLLGKYATAPWIKLMQTKITEILKNNSDIRSYGATRSAEFLAVTTEYFFKRPLIMKKKHPQLYALLVNIYKQNPALKKQTLYQITKTKDNEKCPCGSDIRFKSCCQKLNE